MKGADIFSVPDPATLASDCLSLDVQVVGGYAYDDDVTEPIQWTGSHVQTLRGAGLEYFPICTLRTNSAATADTLISALRSQGIESGLVAFDIENTATPPQSVIAACLAGLRAVGYGPFMGYFWPPATWEPVYGTMFDYRWFGSGGVAPTIPPGWDAVQYGAENGPSGTKYDVDLFADYIPFEGAIMTPEQDARLTAIFQQLTQSAPAGSVPTRGQQIEMLFGQLTNGGNPASLSASFVDAIAAAVVAKLPAAGATLTADDVAAAVTARLKGELS